MRAQAKDKARTGKRVRGKMPEARGRRFVDVAAELDAHAQRPDAIESALVAVAAKAGVPF